MVLGRHEKCAAATAPTANSRQHENMVVSVVNIWPLYGRATVQLLRNPRWILEGVKFNFTTIETQLQSMVFFHYFQSKDVPCRKGT